MEDVPPGFRFYPTEEELVSFYLPHKLDGRNIDLNRVLNRIIPELDVYERNPWDLPRYSGEVCHRDQEQWFFFVPIQDSEARGGRPRRLTTTGYWKATGSPSCVFSSSSDTNHGAIGIKRTMVFYTGRAPNGSKTEWKMNEYKVMEEDNQLHVPSSSSNGASAPTLRKEFSLCRVYKKSKCLRAFDRRPSGNGDIMLRPAVTVPLPAALQLGTDHREDSTYPAAISHAQNIISAAANIYDVEVGRRNTLSSSGSSSSEASQSVQSTGSLPMVFDNGEPVPLWELDQLDYWSFEQD